MGEHEGHRERMRLRYYLEGPNAFAEHEILELLLSYSIPRKDTNLLAHRLIARFGSLPGVLSADLEDLKQEEGVGEYTAILLKLVWHISQKAQTPQPRPLLNNLEKAAAYLIDCFAQRQGEAVYLLCLSEKGWLRACLCIREGSLSVADLNVTQLVRKALLHKADTVILSHNHPSGLALPSGADYEATERIKTALDAVEIPLQDHIIVADRDYVSLRESGYLK
ncbi:MAG: RadC family protein [Oscillibacter sp.]|nr:RadC family protein [Oscillibacter sp.]